MSDALSPEDIDRREDKLFGEIHLACASGDAHEIERASTLLLKSIACPCCRGRVMQRLEREVADPKSPSATRLFTMVQAAVRHFEKSEQTAGS